MDRALQSKNLLLMFLVDIVETISKLCLAPMHFPLIPMNSNQVNATAFRTKASTSCKLPESILEYGPILRLSGPMPCKPSPIHNPSDAKQLAGTFRRL
jgi:hypothetical protein